LNLIRLIRSNLRYHWRTNFALALGVAVGTAVLTGALLVGDSVRGSLLALAMDRLGRIDEVLITGHFFREALAEELAAQPDFDKHFSISVPGIVIEGTVENPEANQLARAGGVTIIGCTHEFWLLGKQSKSPSLDRGQVVLNRPLASELGVDVGNEILLRIGRESEIPADSPLGRKIEAARTVRLTVVEVIAPEGLGRFGLRSSQQVPHLAYVDIATIQQLVEQPDKVNAIFVAGVDSNANPIKSEHQSLQSLLRPKLADYGLELQKSKLGYFNLTSRQMLLDDAVVAAAANAFDCDQIQQVFTYLANTIAKGNRQIPYSTITAVDCNPVLGPIFNVGECVSLADDEIVLNRWAADDLGAIVGDEISVMYFEPETTHGVAQERTATFRLKKITNLSDRAAEPAFTPELVGITDRLSLGDWDPPFPYDSKRIRKKDEDYWKKYRTTPKAFVSLAAGRRMWANRFGNTTSLRIVADENTTREDIVRRLEFNARELGFVFQPIRQQSLLAATGTTPFDLLFLGFSFFLIAASLMLVALLFRLSIEQRAAEIGTLLAVGISRKTSNRLMLSEELIVAACGAIIGTLFGIAYAWLMLVGLRTWWLAAIVTPFLFLHVTWQSLALGALLGLSSAGTTIYFVLRRMSRQPLIQLLAGKTADASLESARTRPWHRIVKFILLALAVSVGIFAVRLGGDVQAGAFFVTGACVLAAALLELAQRLGRHAAKSTKSGVPSLFRLARANVVRNPSRSVLTVGLLASATFLITAISAFRLDPTEAGTGGFALLAESDRPLFANLDESSGISTFDFPVDEASQISTTRIASLRVHAGDDASCLNLYRPRQPRILGLPKAAIDLFSDAGRTPFGWASTIAKTDAQRNNPWILLLDKNLEVSDDAIPVVLDMNTAMYSLHLWEGVGATFNVENSKGEPILVRVVGLLKNSIFQGEILMSEDAFERLFPDVSGYRYFLIDTRGSSVEVMTKSLESTLGDFGFDVQSTHERLARLLAVQNTYLSTFQSLGGLGLLLGTIGLAIVQLRSVLERRREFAVMRATGFRRGTISRIVLLENALLLFGGLAIGLIAALVAVMPHFITGGASLPWLSLIAIFLIVAVMGQLAASLAVRAALNAPLLSALRGN
jgi:putative ABC transport system permease protein